ncbi:TRAP transporter substrate-binding protein [Desulfotomaculum defluvii]
MKKLSKIAISVLSIMLFSIFLTGCGGGGEEKKDAASSEQGKTITLKVAHYFAEEHPQNIALKEKFKPMVEAESNGQIKVEIYPNATLGSEEQFIDGTKNGSVEMCVTGGLIAKDLPMVGLTEMPLLFRDYAHAQKVLNGELGKEIVKGMEEKMGTRTLAWTANGFRVVSSNKAIETFEDIKGLRLRIPNNPIYIEMAKGLGANPMPMPISEVFTALEQNVIDGQENPYATLKASGMYEVQKYVVDSRHLFSPNLYMVNEKFWQGLDPKLQEVVQKAANESAAYEWKLLEESEQKDIEFLKEKGLTVVFPDETFKQKMIDSQKPVQEWFYKTYPGTQEMAEKIMAVQ